MRALIIGAVFFIGACSESGDMDTMQDESAQAMDSLVSVEWLNQHLGDPDLVVLDCSVTLEQDESGGFRTYSGRAAYESGHIPTAGFADLTSDLSDADSPIRYAVPAPEQFAAAMEKLGVGDDTRVVLYDSSGSMWAARVWWMLRWIGFDRAALLDGGLNAWTSAGHALSTEEPMRSPGTITVKLRPQLIADRHEVLAAIDDADVELIDALPEAHYRGEMVMYDRPGHIPTASNVPVFSLLDENGQFKQDDELRELFESNPDDRTITYCGGGIAASADAFILTRLGYEDVAVYTASLQEWAADPANPLETISGAEEAER